MGVPSRYQDPDDVSKNGGGVVMSLIFIYVATLIVNNIASCCFIKKTVHL